jgi:beta-phosphoglucomutase family hydrolase
MIHKDMKTIVAVIFDMDGLMIDSEKIHLKAYNEALKEFGIRISKQGNLKYVGISDTDICKDLVKVHNLEISYHDLKRKKDKAYQSFLNDVEPQQGLINLVEKLHKENYKLAVASSSNIKEIKIIISKLGIEQYFNNLTSADFVRKGKPEPDIFLYAASKLGVKPQKCLVLEDAPSGVLAAKRANMYCYAIPSEETKNENFDAADKVLRSLTEVYEALCKF